MIEKYIVKFITLVALLHGVAGQKFTLSTSTGSWEQGLNACRGIQGTLALVNNPQQQNLFSAQITTAQLGEKVWVGSYEAYTKKVWVQGCFANVTLPSARRTKIIENNFLVTCLHECSSTNSMYIGMQGPYCYCFDSIPVNGGNLPGAGCRNPCPGETVPMNNAGNYLSECGSIDPNMAQYSPVSVYRLARPDEVRIDNTTLNLGECYAYNIRTRTWIPRACSFNHGVVCDRINCRGNLQQCIIEIPTQLSWYRARPYCETNSAFLSVTNVTTSAFFNNRPVMGDVLYWTGLHRKQQMLWTTDNVTSSMSSSGRCLAVMRNQMGGWATTLEDCQQRYRYACFQELTSSSSTTTSTTTATTPRATRSTRRTTPAPWNPWTTTTSGVVTFNPNPQPVNVTEPSSANSIFTFARICFTCFLATFIPIVLI